LTGACFTGTVIAITGIAFAESPGSYEPDMIITPGIMVLLAGITLSVAARLERLWVPIVMIPFGILATAASTAYHVVVNPGQVVGCSIARVGTGYPLPWSFTYNLAGDGRCIVPLVPLYSPLIPRPNIVSFVLDMVFYVAIGLAIFQLYRGIIGKTMTAQTSILKQV
jgi:hypothetical protein